MASPPQQGLRRNVVYSVPRAGYNRSFPIFSLLDTFRGIYDRGIKGYFWIPANHLANVTVLEYLDDAKLGVKFEKLDPGGRPVDTFMAVMDKDQFLKMVGQD